MKYDDASWHYGSDNFPKDLPDAAGGTHIGMYVAWAVLSGLASSQFQEDWAELVEKLNARAIAPGEFFMAACDGKFTDEELGETGQEFTEDYFDMEGGEYIEDYEELFTEDVDSIYEIEDSWANYDQLKPVLDQRLADWKEHAE
ncbi:hypothetical protein Pan97_12160 [Bremerella volcania]|uniref:DUF7832 domain-containing protein n=1 Tax=Bremerella volcania TaxID=2527984 RepID=A0A518C4S0_9BACT|nr:hypothetical protein [Bremerella volcania]QDU74211.1 hypothetical protein Pan97_12160 [Bremerella volcania]